MTATTSAPDGSPRDRAHPDAFDLPEPEAATEVASDAERAADDAAAADRLAPLHPDLGVPVADALEQREAVDLDDDYDG